MHYYLAVKENTKLFIILIYTLQIRTWYEKKDITSLASAVLKYGNALWSVNQACNYLPQWECLIITILMINEFGVCYLRMD